MADPRQSGRGGGIIKSFELQVFKDGVWKIDSIFDDAEFALLEARRADEGKRYASIRVIEERYDEETERTTIRTLFRGGVVANPRSRMREAPASRKQSAEMAQQGAAGKDLELKGRPRAAPRGGGFLLPVVLLLLVVVGGAAALYALHVLGR